MEKVWEKLQPTKSFLRSHDAHLLMRAQECHKDTSVTLVNPVLPHLFNQEAHLSHLTSINIHRKVVDITGLGNNRREC